VIRKVSDVNYVVKTPDRRKPTQLCHINMIKSYHDRGADTHVMAIEVTAEVLDDSMKDVESSASEHDYQVKLSNSEILASLEARTFTQ